MKVRLVSGRCCRSKIGLNLHVHSWKYLIYKFTKNFYTLIVCAQKDTWKNKGLM